MVVPQDSGLGRIRETGKVNLLSDNKLRKSSVSEQASDKRGRKNRDTGTGKIRAKGWQIEKAKGIRVCQTWYEHIDKCGKRRECMIIKHQLGQTRNEQDYLEFIKEMVNGMPQMDQVVILSDQLNTHMSASLVGWIGEMEEYDREEMGGKEIGGYLKNMESRKLFLENGDHRVRFVFTPKHCSWLNPIENWFAKIQRHIIKNGNFISVGDLEDKIVKYRLYKQS